MQDVWGFEKNLGRHWHGPVPFFIARVGHGNRAVLRSRCGVPNLWFDPTHVAPRTRESTVILLIDNYDSFVYNLARYLEELGQRTRVFRNDALTVTAVRDLQPTAIVLSPGPGTPAQAGICVELLRRLSDRTAFLGVCLGHQCIAEAFGGCVVRAPEPVHGRISQILHSGEGLFTALPQPLAAGRYHSLIVAAEGLPDSLEVTATTEDGLIMGLRHRHRPVAGVQFHPESILTCQGHRLLENFLNKIARGRALQQNEPAVVVPGTQCADTEAAASERGGLSFCPSVSAKTAAAWLGLE